MNTKTWVMNFGGVVFAPGLLYATATETRAESVRKNEKAVHAKVVSIKSRASA